MSNEPLSALLLDKLPRMPEEALAPVRQFLPLVTLSDGSSLAEQFFTFGNRFECRIQELLNFDEIEALKQCTIDLYKLVQTDLCYEDPKSGFNNNIFILIFK